MSHKMRLTLNWLHQLDTNMCLVFNYTSEYAIVRQFFRMISRLGDGVFWYVMMILLLLTNGTSAIFSVLHIAVAGLTGTLVYKWLKGKTLRPRPYQVRQDIQLRGYTLDKFSFPSGHTLHAVVFSFVTLGYFPSLMLILAPFTLLVAISRLVLGLHYPSDVLAGAVIGIMIGQLSFNLIAMF